MPTALASHCEQRIKRNLEGDIVIKRNYEKDEAKKRGRGGNIIKYVRASEKKKKKRKKKKVEARNKDTLRRFREILISPRFKSKHHA